MSQTVAEFRRREAELVAKLRRPRQGEHNVMGFTKQQYEAAAIKFLEANPDLARQNFLVTLFYSGGHYKFPIDLGPRATRTFNVSEIIHSRMPDADGNIVPLDVHEGSAQISGPQGESEHILIALDEGTYNVQKATCGSGCVTCQGLVTVSLTDNPFAVAVGGTHQLSFTARFGSGQVYDRNSDCCGSSNVNVATGSNALVSGLAAGSVTMTGTDFEDPLYARACPPMLCPENNGISGSDPGNSVPQIYSVDPNIGLVGTTLTTVTITGKGFGSNPKVNPPAGVLVTGGQSSNDQTIILKGVVIPTNAPIGPNSFTVTVTASDGSTQPSNQGAFTIDGPYYMVVNNDIIATCSGCTTTQVRRTYYQVMNFSFTNAGTVNVGEPPASQVLSGWNCQQSQPTLDSQACPYATNSVGQFEDSWSLWHDGFSSAGGGGCGFNADDHWKWCATGNSVGHLQGYIHNNAIQINGSVMPPQSNAMPAGTVINP